MLLRCTVWFGGRMYRQRKTTVRLVSPSIASRSDTFWVWWGLQQCPCLATPTCTMVLTTAPAVPYTPALTHLLTGSCFPPPPWPSPPISNHHYFFSLISRPSLWRYPPLFPDVSSEPCSLGLLCSWSRGENSQQERKERAEGFKETQLCGPGPMTSGYWGGIQAEIL